MGDPEDFKQIFFTNLLLLGFEPNAMERKWKIPFNKEMFVLPNKKGFETVMHFLFARLNPVQCREEFRDCWPVGDKKREQQFRKVCNNWLTQIVKDDDDAVFPRIVPSLLMSPGGDRIYELLMHFTAYVMTKVMQEQHGVKKRDFIRHPTLTSTAQSSGLGEVMAKTIQCGVVRSRTRFLEQVQQTVTVQDQWKQYGGEQVKAFRNLRKVTRTKEQELHSMPPPVTDHSVASSSGSYKRRSMTQDYDYDIQSVKRAQKVQKVRDMWRILEEFTDCKVQEQEVVESILEGSLEKYKLDSRDLNPRVPDLLLRECEQEIQRRGVDNIYHGGKLNLVSLIHLCNLCLHFYIEKLTREGVPSFADTIPAVSSLYHTHHAHLTNIHSLRLKLEMEFLPQLKANIERLKKKLDMTLLKNHSPSTLRTTSVGLGLLPPSPPVSFEPDQSRTPHDRDSRVPLTHNLRMPGEQASTPEAAAELINHVSQKVRVHYNSRVQGSPVYGPKGRTANDQRPQARPASKLPTRGKVVIEKVGAKQRTRFRSAPTGHKHEHQERQVLRPEPDSVTRVSPAGTAVSELPSSDSLTAVDTHTASHQPRVDHQGFKIPQSAGPLGRATSRVQKAAPPAVAEKRTPPAQRILANKIAEAVVGSTPPRDDAGSSPDLEYLRDPGAALGSDAFQCRDKLARTPATAGRPTWKDTLLHDSVGPLSSTRMDISGRQNTAVSKSDTLVTKLFDQGSDTEESLLAKKSASGLGRPRVDRVRATSIEGGSSISSISPRSDVSLGHDGKHSTFVNDHSFEEHDRTIVVQSDAEFLMEETPSKRKTGLSSKPTNVRPAIERQVLEPEADLESSIPRTPEQRRAKVGFLGYMSPFGKTPQQRESVADSLVEQVMSRDNSLSDDNMEAVLATLQPAHDIAQSLMETKTPCLPSRVRKVRTEAVGATREQLEGSTSGADKVYPDTLYPRAAPGTLSAETMDHSQQDPTDIEEDVRVISFQNGSFTEFMDKSPAKQLQNPSYESKTSGLSTYRLEHTSSPGTNRNSHTQNNSPLKTVQEVSGKETERLIARYKRYVADTSQPSSRASHEADALPTDSSASYRRLTERDVIMGGQQPKPLPLIEETPTSSFTQSYLKTSPPPGKYGGVQESDLSQSIVVKKFTLDVDSDEEVSTFNYSGSVDHPQSDNHFGVNSRQSTGPARASVRIPSGEEGLLQQEFPEMLDLDELDQGVASIELDTEESPAQSMRSSGMVTFPMSPFTDAIHQDSPTTSIKHTTWDNLLKGTPDLRRSPQKPVVPVANLIDL